ncbi:hypothetical protein KP005_04120 [Geomonas nitrogeniifigens]|uniref:Uncharacterized protein n=1 Tax=Geomonas diazotrophica TaxID=2843197 RepID=A0ABX8JKH2_9BACT|nr:hypothetical protein [Geomonas nitrogeniifigens]QWV98481.1 hypothetical protein KP005_04120 [Geomonas nitrogeniifigens]
MPPLHSMTTLRRLKLLLAAAELVCVAASLTAAWQAHASMEMSGLGDLDRFAFWNSIIALSLMLFFLLWVAAVLLALFARQREHFGSAARYWKHLVPDVLLPPVLLAAGWLAFVVLQ